MTLWVLISGTSLGTYFVYIRVLFRTFSVCAVCLENVDFPPFSHEKRASSIALKTLIVELRGFEPLTLSMPWRCATSCAIAPKSALQTLYNIHRRHKSRKFRRVARTEELA